MVKFMSDPKIQFFMRLKITVPSHGNILRGNRLLHLLPSVRMGLFILAMKMEPFMPSIPMGLASGLMMWMMLLTAIIQFYHPQPSIFLEIFISEQETVTAILCRITIPTPHLIGHS